MNELSITVNLNAPEPRNPISIFHLAQGFFLAGNRCLLNIDVGPGVTQCLISPGVVNLCMAIELFLKAIIAHTGATAPKTHKLNELFVLAPKEFQESIRITFNAAIPQPNLDELLPQISEYFVQVRYGHEFNIFALHEHPVYFLAKFLYEQTALQFEQKTGLDHLSI